MDSNHHESSQGHICPLLMRTCVLEFLTWFITYFWPQCSNGEQLSLQQQERIYVSSAFLWRADECLSLRQETRLYINGFLFRSLWSQHIMCNYDDNSILERDPKCGNLVMKWPRTPWHWDFISLSSCCCPFSKFSFPFWKLQGFILILRTTFWTEFISMSNLLDYCYCHIMMHVFYVMIFYLFLTNKASNSTLGSTYQRWSQAKFAISSSFD
jgi:hypothetical protein